MKAVDWKGMITNASPYALPPGGAVVQENLESHIPGQLVSRGGMKYASADVTSCLDMHPVAVSGVTKILALTDEGDLVLRDAPEEIDFDTEPVSVDLSPSSGQVQSNYLGQFYDYDGVPTA